MCKSRLSRLVYLLILVSPTRVVISNAGLLNQLLIPFVVYHRIIQRGVASLFVRG